MLFSIPEKTEFVLKVILLLRKRIFSLYLSLPRASFVSRHIAIIPRPYVRKY